MVEKRRNDMSTYLCWHVLSCEGNSEISLSFVSGSKVRWGGVSIQKVSAVRRRYRGQYQISGEVQLVSFECVVAEWRWLISGPVGNRGRG
jgi:hypothetical protein